MQSHATDLIEQGIVLVETEPTAVNSVEAQPAESIGSKEKRFMHCKICEPLIVQARVNHFRLDEFTAEQLAAASGYAVKGIKYEDFLLPAVLHWFWGATVEQLQEDKFLSECQVLPLF